MAEWTEGERALIESVAQAERWIAARQVRQSPESDDLGTGGER